MVVGVPDNDIETVGVPDNDIESVGVLDNEIESVGVLDSELVCVGVLESELESVGVLDRELVSEDVLVTEIESEGVPDNEVETDAVATVDAATLALAVGDGVPPLVVTAPVPLALTSNAAGEKYAGRERKASHRHPLLTNEVDPATENAPVPGLLTGRAHFHVRYTEGATASGRTSSMWSALLTTPC